MGLSTQHNKKVSGNGSSWPDYTCTGSTLSIGNLIITYNYSIIDERTAVSQKALC